MKAQKCASGPALHLWPGLDVWITAHSCDLIDFINAGFPQLENQSTDRGLSSKIKNMDT